MYFANINKSSTVETLPSPAPVGSTKTLFVIPRAFALSFIACAAGSLGHLVMKALKRDRGIPIWQGQEKGVTGAGGMLDRIDSLCFAAPVFFHSVHWYFGL